MFASMLASWWNGSAASKGGSEEVKRGREVSAEEEARKRKVADDDGIFSSEDEEDIDEEMFEIRRRFRAAADYLPRATDKLERGALLRLYGLYKAATAGRPVPSDRPSIFDQKGRAKFDAWEKAAGSKTKKEAMREYADELEDAKVGFDPTATASTSSGGGGGGGFGMRMSRPMVAEGGDGANNCDDASSPDAMEWHMWVAAMKADDVETARRLLALNPEILLKRESTDGSTGMHWAADSGSLSVCRYLASVRPSLVHEKDFEGSQPLHLAALCGYEEVAAYLLEAGASPTVLNDEQESAIDIAATPAMKELLVARAEELEAAANPPLL